MPDACIDYAIDETGYELVNASGLPPGTYFVVVDAYMQRQNSTGHEILGTWMVTGVPEPAPSLSALQLEQNIRTRATR